MWEFLLKFGEDVLIKSPRLEYQDKQRNGEPSVKSVYLTVSEEAHMKSSSFLVYSFKFDTGILRFSFYRSSQLYLLWLQTLLDSTETNCYSYYRVFLLEDEDEDEDEDEGLLLELRSTFCRTFYGVFAGICFPGS